MKRLLIASVASTLCIGLAPAAALAADISNTGPGSDNTISNENSRECNVNNDNNVDVNNDNSQDSNSGNSNNQNNTTGGGSTSGDSSNSNGSNVGVDINNGGCVPKNAVTPPPAGGKGGGQVKAAVTPTPKVTTLPNTGSGAVLIGTLAGITVGGAAWAVTRRVVSQ